LMGVNDCNFLALSVDSTDSGRAFCILQDVCKFERPEISLTGASVREV
jgi:hypothetical protein